MKGESTDTNTGVVGASGRRYWRKRSANILFTDHLQRVLLARRAAHVDGGGQWGVPGGYLEAGEDFEAGALREVREELGEIPPHIVTGQVDCIDPPHHNRTLVAVLTSFVAAASFRLNDENTDCAWLNRRRLAEIRLFYHAADVLRQLGWLP